VTIVDVDRSKYNEVGLYQYWCSFYRRSSQ